MTAEKDEIFYEEFNNFQKKYSFKNIQDKYQELIKFR